MKTLYDIFPNWLTSGAIFKAFETYTVGTIPWATLNSLNIDIAYIGNHSGEKPISPLVNKLLSADGTLSAANLELLAKVIWQKYSVNWTKLYNILSLQYNPIENYSMTEDMDKDTSNTGTVADSGSNSQTTTYGKVNTIAGNANIYGFNSATASPTTTSGGSETLSGSDSVSGSASNTRTDNLASTEDYTLTRSGNIGVTTSQQMIEAERDLWAWNVFDTIFKDIDKELTLAIYE